MPTIRALHRLPVTLTVMAGSVIPITSFDDPRVDVYRNIRDADLRGRDGLFMAESEMVIRRLVQSPRRLHSILVSPAKLQRLGAVVDHLPAGIPVYVAELPLMHEIAAFHIHRGVLAAGHRLSPDQLTIDPVFAPLRDRPRLLMLAAEGVTNVDNMGALFRNAAAFGADAILLDPTCCDPLYRKAIRVSMGHALSIPYAISDDWPADLDRLKREWGITLVGAELTDGTRPLWQMPDSPRLGILFGSEGHGLSPGALACCDAVCEIPMSNGVPSLNVAVASAVFLYEWRRGEHFRQSDA